MLDKKVADAAFATEKGKFSAPIEGALSTSIVRVLEVTPASVKSFDEVKAGIKDRLQRDRFLKSLPDIHAKVEDERAKGRTLTEIGKDMKLVYRDVGPFDRAGKDMAGKGIEGVDGLASVLKVAFETEVGVEIDSLDLGDKGEAWVEVKTITAVRQKPFEEVKADVGKAFAAEERSSGLAKLAKELADRAGKGEAFDVIAKSVGAEVKKSAPLKRAAKDEQVSGALLAMAFSLPKGATGAAPGADGSSRVVFRVDEIVAAKALRGRTRQGGRRRTRWRHGQRDGRPVCRHIADALRTRRQRGDDEAHRRHRRRTATVGLAVRTRDPAPPLTDAWLRPLPGCSRVPSNSPSAALPMEPHPMSVDRGPPPKVAVEPQFEPFSKAYAAGRPQVLWTRLVADLETPVSAMLKLGRGRANSVLLESVEGGAVRGRYSIIGIEPDLIWRAFGDRAELNRDPGSGAAFVAQSAGTLASLRALIAELRIELPEDLPPMAAGIIGYMSYDTIRLVERLPVQKPDPLGVPDAIMIRPTIIVIFDAVKDEMTVVTTVFPGDGVDARSAYGRAVERLQRVVGALETPIPHAAGRSRARLRRRWQDLQYRASRLHGKGAAGQGVHRRRRHLPGGAVATLLGAVRPAAIRPLPLAPPHQSGAVPVSPRLRRLCRRRLVAGNPGPRARR